MSEAPDAKPKAGSGWRRRCVMDGSDKPKTLREIEQRAFHDRVNRGGCYPPCPACALVIWREQAEALVREAKASLSTCVGYPVCDGDLPGEPHDEKCPEYGKPERKPMRTYELAEALAALIGED